MSVLADRIRQSLDKLGAEALAERTGLSRATLYGLAAGNTSPTLKTLKKLRAAGIRIPRGFLDAA